METELIRLKEEYETQNGKNESTKSEPKPIAQPQQAYDVAIKNYCKYPNKIDWFQVKYGIMILFHNFNVKCFS